MKILLVDDDAAVIQSLLPVLKSDGTHDVRVATTGAKALEHAEALGGPDLLITDVVMDDMDGFHLRAEIEARYPEVRTILITGYDMRGYNKQLSGARLLQKPIAPDELLSAVAASSPNPPEPEPTEPVAHTVPVAPVAAAKPVEKPKPRVARASAAYTGSGRQLGAYRLEEKIGTSRWGDIYRALQVSMGRAVALQTLSPQLHADPASKNEFLADARAKANVQQSSILSVYEAGEVGGEAFYSHELVGGETLADVLQRGAKLDEQMTLRVVGAVAEALAYFSLQKINHAPVTPDAILIPPDHRPRLANIATGSDHDAMASRQEMLRLGEAMQQAADVRAFSPGMQNLVLGLTAGRWPSWAALLQAVKALEPKIIPADAYKLSATDEAKLRAVEEARKRQRRSVIYTVIGFFAMLWVIGLAIWWVIPKSNERNLEEQVQIPAGEFIYQDGQKLTLPAFSIDKYEVTIGQYAKFLEALEEKPTTEFDHKEQPPGKSHVPKDWEIYYGRAKQGKPVKGNPMDLNSPAFMVDWWDAYAYAKWKGRRLPTEQEWEKAARGEKGNIYPWGNEWDPKKCSNSSDYVEIGKGKGNVDGYLKWAPVDAFGGDKSPYGVIGMAGNVAEWTGSWDEANRHPIIRGGTYWMDVRDRQAKPGDPKKYTTTKRVVEALPGTTQEFIGFRTVSP
jgi:formylglycine-generating enzyme required for sulfatase activity/CheY-like chemotaxis protein